MNRWHSDFVRTNGVTLHYHRTGGEGPPLVLAHGITDNGLCWRRVAEALEGPYDMILVDARGHGLSDKPESGYSVEELAADIAGLIQALNIGPTLFMGHSMGGSTGTALLARYPELVRAAVLEDPAWRDVAAASDADVAVRAAEWRALIEANKAKTEAEIIREGRERSPTWAEEEFPDWAQAKRQVAPQVTEMVASRRGDWAEAVARFACPVLLVTGDVAKGAIVSPEVATRAQEINPLVQVAHFPEAGHNVRREAYEGFMDAVTRFFREVSR